MSVFNQLMMKKKGGSSQIQYLQSDGAIYIPLCSSGETLNVKSYKIDIEYLEIANIVGSIFFGTYYSSYGTRNCYGIISNSYYIGPGQIGGYRIYYFNQASSESVTAPQLNNRRIEEKSFTNQQIANSNWGLFGGYKFDTNSGVITYTKCRIWSCILYDGNNNEVANLLPKKENDVLGMYDSIRNKFLPGVGSGSFIAG